jgi:hypothetical protein
MGSEFRLGEDARTATIQSLANALELIDRSKRSLRRATGRAGLPLPATAPVRAREESTRPSTADLLIGALQTQLKLVNGLVERGLGHERGVESLIERLASKLPARGAAGLRASMSLRAHASAQYVRHSFVIQNFVRPGASVRIGLEPFQGPRPSPTIEADAVLRWAGSLVEIPKLPGNHNRWSPVVDFDQSAELVLELPLQRFLPAGFDQVPSAGEIGRDPSLRGASGGEGRRYFEARLTVELDGESRREIAVLLDVYWGEKK